MFASFMRPLRSIVQALVAHDAPNQLAAGFALGMLLGFMPKANLIALSIFVLLFSLRVNKGMGLAAACLFSFTAPLVDIFGNKLGLVVLSAQPMQGTYAAIFNMPLGPWLEIDNTAVIGSFLLGLYLFYPAYWLSYVAFSWQQARVQAATAPVPTSDTTFIVTGTDGRRAA